MSCTQRQHILPMLLLLLLIVDRILPLKLLELRVPAHVPLGTNAQLSCRWELGPSDTLYSVKWYKDGKEFFRHVPRDSVLLRKFELPGVDVQESDDSGSNLTLAGAELQTAGRYRCEVSGEKPLFPTVSGHADMTVVALPDQSPVITGVLPRYRPGSSVQATCLSGRSYPATTLAWYINDEPVAADPPTFTEQGGMVTTSTKIDFTVSEHSFKNNVMKIKCLATLGPVYWRSIEESVVRERAIRKHVPISDVQNPSTRAHRVQSGTCAPVTGITALYLNLLYLLSLQLLPGVDI